MLRYAAGFIMQAIKRLGYFYLIFGLGFMAGVAFTAFTLGVVGIGQPPG